MITSFGRSLQPVTLCEALTKGAPFLQNASLIQRVSSLQKRFTTQISAPLRGTRFFNREKEIKALNTLFNNKPKFSIVTGPANSGKTSLLLYVLDLLAKENRPILHLDLRDRSFHTVDNFQATLTQELTKWALPVKMVKATAELSLKKLFTASINIQPKENFSVDGLNTLHKISAALPEWTVMNGTKTPILFIDEANKLNLLLKDPGGQAALTNIFDWFVRNTKQHERFHVVLGSSDSFFQLWIAKHIGTAVFSSYVIGNLTKEEALQFWQEKLIPSRKEFQTLSPPSFDEAYEVCGGNMFLLEKYTAQYILKLGIMKNKEFEVVRTEKAKLASAYFYETGNQHSHYAQGGKGLPAWNREKLIQMMEKITRAENGFLFYNSLCREMGDEVVNSFINHNLLHLRPVKDFSYDLPEAPDEEPIVTAETPSSVVAMKQLLKDIQKWGTYNNS